MWRTGSIFYRCGLFVPNFRKYEESVPHPHMCEESVPNPQICKKISIKSYHVKNWYQNSRVKSWCQNLTHVKNCRCEKLVLNRHRCQWQNCEELESNAKCSRFGGGGGYCISVRNTHVCYMKHDLVRIFHKVWYVGTKYATCWYQFPACCEESVPIIHSLKFTKHLKGYTKISCSLAADTFSVKLHY